MPQDALHQRIGRRKGPARNHPCGECGGPAYEWAYQHNGKPDEVDSYSPMCRSCHRKLDLRESEVLKASWTGVVQAWLSSPEGQEAARRGRENASHPGRPLSTEEAAALGKRGGQARARNMEADPELRERMVAVARKNLPRVRRRCLACGRENLPAHMANHQKSSGHTGWAEVGERG